MNTGAADRHLEFGLVRQADKIRVVLVFFLMTISLAAGPAILVRPPLAFSALALAALVSIWSLFFLRWDELLLRGRLPLAVVGMSLFDLAWMTAYVVASGGFASPFWALLLLVVVFSGAFFSDASWALPLTALLVAGVYAALAAAGGHADPVLVAAVQAALAAAGSRADPAMIWQLCGRLLIVFCAAWFTWGLARVLERERQTNQRIVGHLTEGVLLLNAEGTILLVNRQLGGFCGLAVDDMMGRNLAALCALPGYALLRKLAADALQQPVGQVTSEVLIEGKRTYDLLCSTVPCGTDDRPLGWVLSVQDLTEIKEQTRLKEQGLGLVSHELRSPLASLRVMAQLLSGISGELDEAERGRVAATIDRETDRLSRLVTGLLDLAKLEQPDYAVARRPVHLYELAERVADLFSLTAAGQGLALAVSVPPDLPPVPGDADRLAQVLYNLVDNALKYTPRGGVITLGAEATADQARLWVRDTGCGLPPESLQVIFQKFGQAPGPEQGDSARGVGLGLYVSRLIALKHGGDLWVSSQVGQGSTFMLTLPLPATGGRSSGAEAAVKEPAGVGV
jgi:PAS domain S-box-containing protein